MTTSLIVLNVIYFSLLLSNIIAGCFLWKNLNFKYRGLVFFIAFTIVIETFALFYARKFTSNGNIYLIYDIGNMGFITWLFFLFMKKPGFKRNILIIGGSAIIIWLIIGLKGNYNEHSNILTCLSSIIFIFYSLSYMLEKMILPIDTYLYKIPDFLFSVFLLFFSSINVLFWIANNYLDNHESRYFVRSMYYIFLAANYIYYLGISIVLYVEFSNNKRVNGNRS